jgi:hypothetical protein
VGVRSWRGVRRGRREAVGKARRRREERRGAAVSRKRKKMQKQQEDLGGNLKERGKRV